MPTTHAAANATPATVFRAWPQTAPSLEACRAALVACARETTCPPAVDARLAAELWRVTYDLERAAFTQLAAGAEPDANLGLVADATAMRLRVRHALAEVPALLAAGRRAVDRTATDGMYRELARLVTGLNALLQESARADLSRELRFLVEVLQRKQRELDRAADRIEGVTPEAEAPAQDVIPESLPLRAAAPRPAAEPEPEARLLSIETLDPVVERRARTRRGLALFAAAGLLAVLLSSAQSVLAHPKAALPVEHAPLVEFLNDSARVYVEPGFEPVEQIDDVLASLGADRTLEFVSADGNVVARYASAILTVTGKPPVDVNALRAEKARAKAAAEAALAEGQPAPEEAAPVLLANVAPTESSPNAVVVTPDDAPPAEGTGSAAGAPETVR